MPNNFPITNSMNLKIDNTMATITKDQEYTTRSGLPVRIYATDGAGDYPVHGALFSGGGWKAHEWGNEGIFQNGDQCPLDLIPKPKTHKLDAWLNIYRTDTGIRVGSLHDSSFQAGVWGSGATARIRIEREITEGEGL